MKRFIYAVATLSGTIIGVGIFSLPYITVRVGLWIMLVYLFTLGGLVVLLHYMFGEVALKTPDFLRLPGYARFYLGKWGKRTALISTIIGSFGSLLAYIIIGGQFLTNLLQPIFGGSNFFYVVLYFICGSFAVFLGIRAISKINLIGLILFFSSLIIIFICGMPHMKIGNLAVNTGGVADIFLPYGAILFAFWGASMIPEIEELMGEQKRKIRKVIPIATLIPLFAYLFFIILVMGISGANTSQEAISGLKNFLGPGITSLAFLAGVITTFTSFIAIALTLKKVFWYDFKFPKYLSWLIAIVPPFVLFLLGFQDFIKVIGFLGGAMLAIDGILILLMYRKAGNPRFKFLAYPLVLIFTLGLIYEIIYFSR